MNDCSVPAAEPRECASRRMYGLSLFCVFAGLAVMIGGFIVRSASVVDEMSASANLVIPRDSAVMSDGEFIRSLLPVVGASGIVHLVGVIAGLVGRARAEGRRELGRCALGVGANAFFLACACVIPAVGIVAVRAVSFPSSSCAALRSWLRVAPCSSVSFTARARSRWVRGSRAYWRWSGR